MVFTEKGLVKMNIAKRNLQHAKEEVQTKEICCLSSTQFAFGFWFNFLPTFF